MQHGIPRRGIGFHLRAGRLASAGAGEHGTLSRDLSGPKMGGKYGLGIGHDKAREVIRKSVVLTDFQKSVADAIVRALAAEKPPPMAHWKLREWVQRHTIKPSGTIITSAIGTKKALKPGEVSDSTLRKVFQMMGGAGILVDMERKSAPPASRQPAKHASGRPAWKIDDDYKARILAFANKHPNILRKKRVRNMSDVSAAVRLAGIIREMSKKNPSVTVGDILPRFREVPKEERLKLRQTGVAPFSNPFAAMGPERAREIIKVLEENKIAYRTGAQKPK